jgi:hypothetical protein
MYEYYQLMGDMDWAVWRRELEQRRDDVRKDLCRDIKIKKGSDIEGYINSFFNRSWDGLLAAIGSRTGMITTFDEAKLEAILSRVLSASKPSGGDYDYEFQTPGHDDYDIEEFQSADAPAAAGRRGAGEVYAGNALPDAEADSFGEFEEAGMDAGEPPADGGQPDDWEELEDAGMADDGTNEGKETSGFHNGISLFTYSPRNMYSSLRNSPDVTDAPEFAEQDEDLPELYGDDEQALADRPVSGPVEPSYGEFVRGAPSAYPHKIFVPPPETAAEAGEPVIKKSSNGIDYINSAALTGADSDTSNIDPEMKHLVESVLRKPAGF